MAQLGIVTYNIAKDWDLPTILSRLEKLGYEGVELRTTHATRLKSTSRSKNARRCASDSKIRRCNLRAR